LKKGILGEKKGDISRGQGGGPVSGGPTAGWWGERSRKLSLGREGDIDQERLVPVAGPFTKEGG